MLVEWVASVVAAIALIAAFAAIESWRVTRERSARRAVLDSALDAGHKLLRDAATVPRIPEDELRRRSAAWEDMAQRAVERADPTKLRRYLRPIPGTPTMITMIVRVRMARLEEIRDGI